MICQLMAAIVVVAFVAGPASATTTPNIPGAHHAAPHFVSPVGPGAGPNNISILDRSGSPNKVSASPDGDIGVPSLSLGSVVQWFAQLFGGNSGRDLCAPWGCGPPPSVR